MTLELTDRPTLKDASALRLLCLLPSIPLGGMERAAIRVAEHLGKRGAALHFAADRRWGVDVQRAITAIGAPWTGVSHPATFRRPRTLQQVRAQAVSLVVSKSEFENLFRSFGGNALMVGNVNVAYFARGIARRETTSSVFRIPNPPMFDLASSKGRLERSIWRTVAQSFDHLVCNSNYTAEQVARVVGGDDKIRLIRNYPPAPRSAGADPMRLTPGRRYVVYLGQISEAKGVGALIDAVIRIAPLREDVDFVLAGEGVWRDSFAADMRTKVESAGLTDRVRFLGAVEDVPSLLAQCHLHVCPSLSAGDSFPNAILDAKQAALASIVFPTAGLPEAVTDGVDGMVAKPNVEALATAMLDLLDNEPRRAAMSAAARVSLARFDPEALTDQWLNLFLPRA